MSVISQLSLDMRLLYCKRYKYKLIIVFNEMWWEKKSKRTTDTFWLLYLPGNFYCWAFLHCRLGKWCWVITWQSLWCNHLVFIWSMEVLLVSHTDPKVHHLRLMTQCRVSPQGQRCVWGPGLGSVAGQSPKLFHTDLEHIKTKVLFKNKLIPFNACSYEVNSHSSTHGPGTAVSAVSQWC